MASIPTGDEIVHLEILQHMVHFISALDPLKNG
jgi:hypothetical protein